jgi:hypothetical protein
MIGHLLFGMALALGQGHSDTTQAAPAAVSAPQATEPAPQTGEESPATRPGKGQADQPTPPVAGADRFTVLASVSMPAPVPTLPVSPDETPVTPRSLAVTLPSLPPTAPSPPAPAPAPKEYRRAMPAPYSSPPLPGSEYQGYPIIGVPPDTTRWPLMKAYQGTYFGDILDSEKIRAYGWITAEANWSTSKNTNTPTSYWIRPNNGDLDQAVFRFDRNLDSVQTDHIDWGFRSTILYGIDYRYMTAGGWFSDQLLKHNFLYGWDPTEQYIDVYIPWVAQGVIIRVGRWIACPDIETQFAPDNYNGSHSLLFTFDTYTQTGIMASFKLSDQWEFQAAIHSGTDMAPWYQGAIPTGAFGIRWVAKSNNDAFYGWLNAINDAKFRRFNVDGQPSGHDNFNYLVGTWEHKFNQMLNTKTEAYLMWQRDAVVGGTPSIGPVEPFGGGGGIGRDIPGTTLTFGVVNFTMRQFSPRDYLTFRNEWWKDTDGERSGFPSTYTSNVIGWCHNFTPYFQVRPEIGYYRSWTVPAFDNGLRKNEFMCAFDVTLRF